MPQWRAALANHCNTGRPSLQKLVIQSQEPGQQSRPILWVSKSRQEELAALHQASQTPLGAPRPHQVGEDTLTINSILMGGLFSKTNFSLREDSPYPSSYQSASGSQHRGFPNKKKEREAAAVVVTTRHWVSKPTKHPGHQLMVMDLGNSSSSMQAQVEAPLRGSVEVNRSGTAPEKEQLAPREAHHSV